MWAANWGGTGALVTKAVSAGLAYNVGTDSVIRLYLTASDSNGIYGRTSGVSVPAVYALMIIKE